MTVSSQEEKTDGTTNRTPTELIVNPINECVMCYEETTG